MRHAQNPGVGWHPKFNLNNQAVIQSNLYMTQLISRFLFPTLQPDQQRRKMNSLIIIVLVMLLVGGGVAAAIFFWNKH
jgi:hypothetical protein